MFRIRCELRGLVEFIGECAAFPAGANDDQVDAWSQGVTRLMRIKAEPPARRS